MNENPHILKAFESILQHDYEQAIECFELAIAGEPNNASYYYRLSITCARSNKLLKAIDHAITACRLEPEEESYRLHLNMMRARQMLFIADDLLKAKNAANVEEAVATLQSAIRLDPLSIEAYLMLSIAYEQSARINDAISIVTEAVRLDPEHKEAGEWLEQLLQRMNNKD